MEIQYKILYFLLLFSGPLRKKVNSELFVYDNTQTGSKTPRSYNDIVAEKKKYSLEPPQCFHIMQPWSSVPDPITKRYVNITYIGMLYFNTGV